MLNLLNEVARIANVNADTLRSPTRKPNAVAARQIYCYIAVANRMGTIIGIGKQINRHHATVLHSVRIAEDRIKYERDFRNLYKTVMEKLNPDVLQKFRAINVTATDGRSAMLIEDKQHFLIGIVMNQKYYSLHKRKLSESEDNEVQTLLKELNIELK